MGCTSCELVQEHGQLIVPVRVDNANVEIRGCPEHTRQLLATWERGQREEQVLARLQQRIEVWQDSMRQVTFLNQLAVILGGSEDSWTGILLRLCAHSDPGHLAQLRTLYPDVVLAWQAWRDCDPPPTPAELWGRIAELAAKEL